MLALFATFAGCAPSSQQPDPVAIAGPLVFGPPSHGEVFGCDHGIVQSIFPDPDCIEHWELTPTEMRVLVRTFDTSGRILVVGCDSGTMCLAASMTIRQLSAAPLHRSLALPRARLSRRV